MQKQKEIEVFVMSTSLGLELYNVNDDQSIYDQNKVKLADLQRSADLLRVKNNKTKEDRRTLSLYEDEIQHLNIYFNNVKLKRRLEDLDYVYPVEFSEWWWKYLRVYNDIFKDKNTGRSTNKYYYLHNEEDHLSRDFREIHIVNSYNNRFDRDINNVVYVKNISYDHNSTVVYLYKDIVTNEYLVYHRKEWTYI